MRQRRITDNCTVTDSTLELQMASAISQYRFAPLAEQERIVAAIEEQFSRLDAGVAALEQYGRTSSGCALLVSASCCDGHLSASRATTWKDVLARSPRRWRSHPRKRPPSEERPRSALTVGARKAQPRVVDHGSELAYIVIERLPSIPALLTDRVTICNGISRNMRETTWRSRVSYPRLSQRIAISRHMLRLSPSSSSSDPILHR